MVVEIVTALPATDVIVIAKHLTTGAVSAASTAVLQVVELMMCNFHKVVDVDQVFLRAKNREEEIQ